MKKLRKDPETVIVTVIGNAGAVGRKIGIVNVTARTETGTVIGIRTKIGKFTFHYKVLEFRQGLSLENVS